MLQVHTIPPQAIERMRSELSAGGKGEEGKEEKSYKVEFLPLDLSSFQSTTDFVLAFKEKDLPLHILINNAAVFGVPYSKQKHTLGDQICDNH